MLAPSAITIRRPSCEADLILTRGESESPFYPGLCPSDSVQSAPLYDCWAPNCDDVATSGTGDRLCVTKRRTDSFASTTSGPDPRGGRYWHRRSVPRICEDTSGSEAGGVGQQGATRVGVGTGDGGFRRASLTLRRSIDSLLCSLSSPKRSLDLQTGLTIEVIQESPLFRRRSRLGGQRRKSLDRVQEDIDDDSFFAQSNLSLSLILTSLKDGCLCAEIPIGELEEVPSGHVTIRVRNFNLDVSLSSSADRAGTCLTTREPREPCYRGTVSLPIYVNPATLQFRLDESKNVVHLEGRIKGCCTRMGSSLSAMELSSQAGLVAPPVPTPAAGAGM